MVSLWIGNYLTRVGTGYKQIQYTSTVILGRVEYFYAKIVMFALNNVQTLILSLFRPHYNY